MQFKKTKPQQEVFVKIFFTEGDNWRYQHILARNFNLQTPNQ